MRSDIEKKEECHPCRTEEKDLIFIQTPFKRTQTAKNWKQVVWCDTENRGEGNSDENEKSMTTIQLGELILHRSAKQKWKESRKDWSMSSKLRSTR
jgi:hypothetical protein